MNSTAQSIREAFYKQLDGPLFLEHLFDHVLDITFFIKDHHARYIVVNESLCQRCGATSKEAMIGKTAGELFSAPSSIEFADQDQEVLKLGKTINGRLERHRYPDGEEGWCLTYKEPIFDANRKIIGLSGISRNLNNFSEKGDDLSAVSEVLRYIQNNIDQPLRLSELAAKVQLSVYQLDQRIRAIYQISPGQLITRSRVEAACHMLQRSAKSISTVALDCGYSDQSAFSRQFKQSTGITPKSYRERISHQNRRP